MENDLEERTLAFAIRCLDLVDALPRSTANNAISSQFARSSTAIGAIYGEACRAETRKDFIHKIGLSAKEASETCYWLKIINKRKPSTLVTDLLDESKQLLKILVSSGRTAKRRL